MDAAVGGVGERLCALPPDGRRTEQKARFPSLLDTTIRNPRLPAPSTVGAAPQESAVWRASPCKAIDRPYPEPGEQKIVIDPCVKNSVSSPSAPVNAKTLKRVSRTMQCEEPTANTGASALTHAGLDSAQRPRQEYHSHALAGSKKPGRISAGAFLCGPMRGGKSVAFLRCAEPGLDPKESIWNRGPPVMF